MEEECFSTMSGATEDEIKIIKELMKVLRSHKLSAGQALSLLDACKGRIGNAMQNITVF